jgi:hypothetical protein
VNIEKSRLKMGMSYALKSSVLERALSQAGIELEVQLIYSAGNPFFSGYYWPPNPNVAHERLYIQAGAVSSEDCSEARQYIESSVMPMFVAWAKSILALPANSPIRREKQHFSSTSFSPSRRDRAGHLTRAANR